MIDRKKIEKLMVKYAKERDLKSFWLHFHSNDEGENPFFSVYEDEEFIAFEEQEQEKEKTIYRVAVKIVDDENIEEKPVYLMDAKYELLSDAMEDFGRFNISEIWLNSYLRDKETYRTKSIEESIIRLVEGNSYKLIAFASYGVREYEAELH